MTWQAYAPGLEARLAALPRRVHRGTYRAYPSRSVSISQPDGRQRPLGSTALEDKLVQQAVVTILTQIDEEDLRGFASGDRPRRRPHHAVDALSVALTRKRVNDVLDWDMRGCFETLSHAWLVTFLQHRVADPRLLRRIPQWRRAGVAEDGQWSETTGGVPPGAVVSPVLANGDGHDVFDLWVEAWRTRTAHGAVVVGRCADDRVLGFEHRSAAARFLAAMRDRLHPFGLERHAEQTRLIECGPHAIANRTQRGEGNPETFDGWGFTHRCERPRKTGYFTGRRKTARQRMGAKLKAIPQPLRQRRHEPTAQTGPGLTSVVQGYCNDQAGPGTMRTLGTFRRRVIRLWRRPRCRRRQKARLPWPRLTPLIRRGIPAQRILHPFPRVRFDARHPRSEPYAVAPHVRIWAGGAG